MKTFEYRLYPTELQQKQLMACLIQSRLLYNEMLEKTIKHYVTNILQKLQVRSRVEAALIAAGKGNIRVN